MSPAASSAALRARAASVVGESRSAVDDVGCRRTACRAERFAVVRRDDGQRHASPDSGRRAPLRAGPPGIADVAPVRRPSLRSVGSRSTITVDLAGRRSPRRRSTLPAASAARDRSSTGELPREHARPSRRRRRRSSACRTVDRPRGLGQSRRRTRVARRASPGVRRAERDRGARQRRRAAPRRSPSPIAGRSNAGVLVRRSRRRRVRLHDVRRADTGSYRSLARADRR